MKRIYNEIAKKYKTTPEEVEREIKLAISLARKNPSPLAQAFWEGTNENAAIEDIIGCIADKVALVV